MGENYFHPLYNPMVTLIHVIIILSFAFMLQLIPCLEITGIRVSLDTL